MEATANQFTTLPISLYYTTVLLEVDFIGRSSKYCQLLEQEFLQHHYVTSGSNCNSSAAF